MKYFLVFCPMMFCIVLNAQKQGITASYDTVVLKNNKVKLVLTLKGGCFVDLKLKGKPINPFDWSLPVENQPEINKKGFAFRGHFISLGNWGMPTPGEQKQGVRLYGEPTAQIWSKKHDYTDSLGRKVVSTSFESKIEGLSLDRKIALYGNEALFEVKESVTNDLPISRIYNFLQHPTFGGEFVSKKLRINTNATHGFYQKGAYPRISYEGLEADSFHWPNGILPDGKIDLRTSGNRNKTYLTSHIFPKADTLGWATVGNPEKGIMIGYIWKTEEYPWLNVWHQSLNGKVTARAIEFATCGIGLNFKELITNDHSFYGNLSFETIDAKQTITKSYYLFVLEIPTNFLNTTSVSLTKDRVIVKYLTDLGEGRKVFYR